MPVLSPDFSLKLAKRGILSRESLLCSLKHLLNFTLSNLTLHLFGLPGEDFILVSAYERILVLSLSPVSPLFNETHLPVELIHLSLILLLNHIIYSFLGRSHLILISN